MFCPAHVIGEQPSGFPPPVPPQTLGIPPPPQVPASQPPHWTTPPHLVSVAAPQLAPSCAQVEGVHPVLPSPKLAKPSPPPASESGAEESLPPELLLVASAEASFENDEGPLPWPPPQPGTTAA
jgi:zinc transporter 1/2/3